MKRVAIGAAALTALAVVGAAGAAAPPGRYTTSTHTVKDNVTGLTWQRAVDGALYTHAAADNACQTSTVAGFTDWRLPTVKELLSIVDRTEGSPTIDRTAFPDTPGGFFWTKTAYAGASGMAWAVYFNYGGFGYRDTTDTNLVRCVR